MLNDKETDSLAEEVYHAMDGSDYGQGELEDMRATNHKTREILSRLLAVLVKKELLSETDLDQIRKYIF